MSFFRVSPPDALPLEQSVRRYWRHLVPMTLFPPFAFAMVIWLRTPWVAVVLAPAFFGSGYYALRPVVKGWARFSFWLAAMALYMAGAVLGLTLVIGYAVATGR